MTRARVSVSFACLAVLAVACSEANDSSTDSTGGYPSNSGGTGAGGASTGGAGPLGGNATGGIGATGAVGVTGGAFPTGGALPVGGTGGVMTPTGGTIPTGGSLPTGGTTTGGGGGGGTSTGGALPTGGGGSDTGGALPTGGGGASTGGVDGTGGDATGGAAPVEPTLITSGPGAYWQEGEVTVGGNSPNITVNDGQEFQHWTGWGGTFNEKGWDAMKALSSDDRERAIRLLFDRNEGCGFTWGRIPIGSSDYGLSRYSLDETAGDYDMQNFSIDRDRQDLIPYIKAALAVKSDIRFWGTAWSPPPWMKDNNAFDRGNMKGDAQTLGAYALYLARFVEEYENEGIYVEAVGPQNEPGYPQDYPSCVWSSTIYTDFVANHLGPLFSQRLPDREIWAATMSNPNSNTIVQGVMNNSTARGYITRIGAQWGQDQHVSQYVSSYGLPVMQTEHQCGNYPWEGGYQQTAPNDQAYAVESWGLIKKWIENGVDSYSAWNMVLDTVGRSLDDVRPWAQNALLTVNVGSGELILTPTYYVFRHLAQYVEPGSVRVGVSGGSALAWKNPDGSIVTVMYNSGGSAAQTTLSVAGTMVQFQIPANGWATVNWQG